MKPPVNPEVRAMRNRLGWHYEDERISLLARHREEGLPRKEVIEMMTTQYLNEPGHRLDSRRAQEFAEDIVREHFD